MTGNERRGIILQTIQNSTRPVPARALAEELGVSRQVIVQDMALIRAKGYDILSTNRGYILLKPETCTRVVKVRHTGEEIEDELQTMVDLGAEVVNVMVNHKLYGRIEAPMHITSRKEVREFLQKMAKSQSGPLMNTTSAYHYHTLRADGEEILDEVEKELESKGYLIRKRDI